jgi:hypothetical protein
MAPEADERARREAESLQRQAQMLEQRRPEIETRTSSALRRTLIVLAVFALAFLLWRSAA